LDEINKCGETNRVEHVVLGDDAVAVADKKFQIKDPGLHGDGGGAAAQFATVGIESITLK